MTLLIICGAFISGILAGPLLPWPAWLWALPFPLFLAAIAARQKRRVLIISGICLLAFCGGAFRYVSSQEQVTSANLQYYNDRGSAVVTGMVSDYPQVRGQSLEFKLAASSITSENCSARVSGNALVRLPFYRQVSYGDILEIRGSPQAPKSFDDFDYSRYLANQGIHTVLNYPSTSLVESDRGFPLLSWVYSLRQALAASLESCLPGPQSSLAEAILLGLRGSLPDSLLQQFYATGTTHLIAISGMNLTIILGMVMAASIWIFGRRNNIYIWICLAFIWLYTVLTGLPATMVRATIMGSVSLMGGMLGRQRSGLTALALAAGIMACIDPAVLQDVSFQLSFLSMLGLVIITPSFISFSMVTTPARGSRYPRYLRNIAIISFASSVSALIATWPVIALNFHQLSLVSAPATFFAMPAFPPIIITSLLTATGGLVWQPMGIVLGWLAWLFLSYFLLVVQIFSSIPAGYLQDIHWQPWQAILYYIILAGMLAVYKYRREVRALLSRTAARLQQSAANMRWAALQPVIYITCASLVLSNALVWTAFACLPDGRLHLWVLDVGQGEAMLIRTPQGQNIVIDTGPDPVSACAQLGRTLPFWDRKINLLLLTQMQADHISGTLKLLQKHDVEAAVLPPDPGRSALPREIMDRLENKHITLYTVYEGLELDIGKGIRLAVLNPPPEPMTGTADDANNNSVVLKVTYNDVSFLLASDIGSEAEQMLEGRRADLKCSVLKVAHHGSRRSSSDEFLAIASPAAAVISAGEANSFGHPHRETLERLSAMLDADRIFITSKRGNIEFITDGRKLWYRTDKDRGLAP